MANRAQQPPAMRRLLRGRWVLPLLAGAACACSHPSHIGADALLAAIAAGAPPAIIDVRTQGEYERSHVPGAVHIPFYALLTRSDEIPAAPGTPVVVYCEHGPRAGLAKLALRLAGFDNVRYLEGHMSAWKQRGLPVETSAPPP